MEETWKKINDYDNYMVSNLGKVKSLNFRRTKVEKILKITKHSVGYSAVSLSKNGKLTPFLVHRLVACAFLNNNKRLSDVNHINGNKKDNDVNNLEWVSHSENQKHAYKMGLNRATNNKIIINIENGIFYQSITEASKTTNTSIQYLSMMLNGICKNKTNLKFT